MSNIEPTSSGAKLWLLTCLHLVAAVPVGLFGFFVTIFRPELLPFCVVYAIVALCTLVSLPSGSEFGVLCGRIHSIALLVVAVTIAAWSRGDIDSFVLFVISGLAALGVSTFVLSLRLDSPKPSESTEKNWEKRWDN